MMIKKEEHSCSCASKAEAMKAKILENLENKEINQSAVKETLNQAEKSMEGFLKREHEINRKLSASLFFYLFLLVAFMFISIFLQQKNNFIYFVPLNTFIVFAMVSICVFFAAYCKNSYFSFPGSYPHEWLQKDIISGDDRMFSLHMLRLIFQCKDRTIEIEKNNNEKMRLCNTGLLIGFVGCITAIIIFLTGEWVRDLISSLLHDVNYLSAVLFAFWGILVALLVYFCYFYAKLEYRRDKPCKYCHL